MILPNDLKFFGEFQSPKRRDKRIELKYHDRAFAR